MLAGLLLSPKLWLSSRLYPLTPVWSGLHPIPPPFDWVLYGALLVSVAAAAVWPRAVATFLGLAAAMVAFDQSRLQPWLYQYSFMLLALGFGGDPKNVCRLIMASVYFWSGVQKLNGGFVDDAFPWLVGPFHGWIPLWAGRVVPFIEAGMAIGCYIGRHGGRP
jgi:hypothetical protein